MKARHAPLAILVTLALFPISAWCGETPDFEELNAYITDAVEDYDLTGLSVAIVKDGEVVFAKGYGVRDVETGEPVTPDSLFNIASCSKAFTAAAVAMLTDDGKIRLDDKVADYVPELRVADPYITQELNLIDILTHRTGLGTFYGDLLWYHTDYDNREIIRRMRHLPITNDFRSEFGYQNNMYMVAGETVKAVTGKSWSEFVTERIFLPLGMSESRTCGGDLSDGQNVAMPHLRRERHEIAFVRPHAAGSIFSSARELSNWILMLLNEGSWQEETILKEETVETLFAPATIIDVPRFWKDHGVHFRTYGLGWSLWDYSGRKIASHGGGMPGYISQVVLVPEDELGIVLLSNDMNLLVRALQMKILDEYLNDNDVDWAAYLKMEQVKRERQVEERAAQRRKDRADGTHPSLELDRYVGTYRDKMYGDAKIEMIDERLVLTLLPTAEWFTSPMEHWHHDTFRIEFRDPFLPEGFVTFRLSSQAKIEGFTIDLPNPDFHFFNLKFERVAVPKG